MIRLALRFDDPSATSDRGLEEAIFAAAQTAGIPLTVAVIPFRRQEGGLIPLSRERAAHLLDAQRAGVIEVAQHGYCHESSRGGKRPPSEFMGEDASRQIELIGEGRALLGTIFDKTVSGFVPPWNTFDANTTQALEKLKYGYLSASWELDAGCSPGLSYLPRTCLMVELQETLSALEAFASLDPVVVAVMHHHDFSESGNPLAPSDLNRFKVLLQTLTRHERVQTMTLSKLAGEPLAHHTSRQRQNAWEKLPWKIR
ncbi:MAG: DUF2334 domain-containing protein, partial [Sulfuricella sp.]|nr:DUF2334 domain-containing protein [Sulfuricella sp.]